MSDDDGVVVPWHTCKSDYFEDEATIGDQQVPNDAVLYVVLKTGEGAEDFEKIDVESSAEDAEPSKGGEA